MVQDVVQFMVTAYRQNQGVLRALSSMARVQGNEQFLEREQRIWMRLFPLIEEIVRRHPDEIAHPDPGFAIQLGFQQLVFTIHEFSLWGPLREGQLYDQEQVIDELVRAFLAYLAVKET
jgi:hypothetical protein